MWVQLPGGQIPANHPPSETECQTCNGSNTFHRVVCVSPSSLAASLFVNIHTPTHTLSFVACGSLGGCGDGKLLDDGKNTKVQTFFSYGEILTLYLFYNTNLVQSVIFANMRIRTNQTMRLK